MELTTATGGNMAPSDRQERRRQRRAERDAQLIWGVPARFMKPRLVFLAAVFFLMAFGLLMIYSSSSVVALSETGDPLYYVERQLITVGGGIILAIVIAGVGYRTIMDHSRFLLYGILLLLTLVWLPFAGQDAYGASRWIALGGFTLQPSEFAKPVIIVCAADLFERFYGEGSLDREEYYKLLVIEVLLPLLLIFAQPDKGTVMVLGISLLVMLYLSGCSGRSVGGLLAVLIVGFVGVSLATPYSRARLVTMIDPWKDEFGSGYQLIQGFYAFGSGGILGQGIGMSHQKYSYLPMAFNDFIYAVIGEECGLVGTLAVLAGFAVLLWAGYKVARYAPDLAGQLIAFGCSILLFVQMLLNVAGVIGIFPLSGKPIPFISYGGSSAISSLMLVGLVFSVSKESRLSFTEYDERREGFKVVGDSEESLHVGGYGSDIDVSSQVGEPTPRSMRGRDGRPNLTLVDGTRATRSSARGVRNRDEAPSREAAAGHAAGPEARGERRGVASHPEARVTIDSQGRERIDLGPSPSDRLRIIENQPRVRGGRTSGDSSKRSGRRNRRS